MSKNDDHKTSGMAEQVDITEGRIHEMYAQRNARIPGNICHLATEKEGFTTQESRNEKKFGYLSSSIAEQSKIGVLQKDSEIVEDSIQRSADTQTTKSSTENYSVSIILKCLFKLKIVYYLFES